MKQLIVLFLSLLFFTLFSSVQATDNNSSVKGSKKAEVIAGNTGATEISDCNNNGLSGIGATSVDLNSLTSLNESNSTVEPENTILNVTTGTEKARAESKTILKKDGKKDANAGKKKEKNLQSKTDVIKDERIKTTKRITELRF